MQPRNAWCAFIVAATLAGSSAAMAQQSPEPRAHPEEHQWATYHNARYGTTADYPADLLTVRAWIPGNDGGQIFRTADGRAQLMIYGKPNFEEDSPSFYVQKHFNRPDVTYKNTKWPSFIVSGVRKGEAFYYRCNFKIIINGILDCMEMRYPAKDKAVWDPIVTRISNSLRAGKGTERPE
jgi:hypothetical protein